MTRWHDEKLERDSTPSRSVVHAYRNAMSDEDSDAQLTLVHYRGTRKELEIGLEYSRSPDPLDRAVGADILAQLGGSPGTFLPETADRLIALLSDPDSLVIRHAAIGLGHRSDPNAAPHLAKLAGHFDPSVRFGVGFGLSGFEEPEAIEAKISLSQDSDREVRNWAVFGLGTGIEADSPQIREALWRALSDEDSEIRGEALVGLAARHDPRTVDAIQEEWNHDMISLLSIEAAETNGDPRLLPALEEFSESLDLERDSYFEQSLRGAMAACSRAD